ncbi:hypothetical protein [Thermus phage TSP4]|nr:hypothetical protein [Thermus phage TSP4]
MIAGWQIRPKAVSEEHLADSVRERLQQIQTTLTEGLSDLEARLAQLNLQLGQELSQLASELASQDTRVSTLEENLEAARTQLLNSIEDLRSYTNTAINSLYEELNRVGGGEATLNLTPQWYEPGTYNLTGTIIVLKTELTSYGSLKVLCDGEVIAEYLDYPGVYKLNPAGIGLSEGVVEVQGPGRALILQI